MYLNGVDYDDHDDDHDDSYSSGSSSNDDSYYGGSNSDNDDNYSGTGGSAGYSDHDHEDNEPDHNENSVNCLIYSNQDSTILSMLIALGMVSTADLDDCHD